jgi:signal transduction histidine kinase
MIRFGGRLTAAAFGGWVLSGTPSSDPIDEVPQQHTMVQTVNVAGRSLLGLVNDVLDMAKIEAGKLALVTADMDLLQVVESVLSPTPLAQTFSSNVL